VTAGIGAADAAIYTGICVENMDPTGQGRIKFLVPQLSGTTSFGWASPVSPGVTNVGDYVYIAFEGGDRNRPLYWPDKPQPISYPTYAAMIAANPISSTAAGTTYYIVDHGGNVQLQNTGVTATSLGWQWLPSGLQNSAISSSDVSATGSTANLVASTALNNPSAKRNYKVSIDSLVWASGSGLLAGLAVTTSTTPPSSSLPAFTTSWLLERQASVGNNGAGVSPGSAVSLSYAHILTNFPLGLVYVSTYLVNNYNSGTAVTTSSGTTQIAVEDVGANS
jgi:hypothetical protein